MGYYQGDYYMAGAIQPAMMPSHTPAYSAGPAGFTEAGILGALPGLASKIGPLLKKIPPGALGKIGTAVAGGAAGAVVGRILRGGDEERRHYRRMNVANVRALRRSMRRVQGFAKLARKTVSFTQRVKMKKRRR